MGSRLVKDINPSGSSSPNELISVNGLLFFTAEIDPKADSDNGVTEESQSDDETNQDADTSIDSEAGTNEEGSETSNEDIPSNTTSTADISLTDTASGTGTVALMRSDGTAEGTTTLKTFDSVTNLVEAGDQLYFIANKNDEYQLWTSDGTTRGTKQVKDLYPGADPRFPQDLFEIDGVLFYSAIDGTGDDGKYPYVNGYEVWRKEGNGVGSRFFRNLMPDKIITDVDISEEEETVLDADGIPIQVPTGADGELEEQTRVVYTATVTTEIYENDSFPQDFTGLNGNYFFTAQSSAFYSLDTRTDPTLIGGLELWFSDGTEAGTRPININQNAYTFYEPEIGEYTPADIVEASDFGFKSASSGSFPRELTPGANELFFVANDGITGFELWSISDQGTNPRLISDLRPGNTSSSPEELTVVGDDLYFSADNGGGRQLFHFNPAQGAPRVIQNSGTNPKELTAIDNKVYYSAESELGRELWVIKNGQAQIVQDINPGTESSSPENLTVATRIKRKKSRSEIKNFLYFSANDGSNGFELMSLEIKGNKNNINLEADVTNSPQSSFPKEITNHDQQIFFTAKSRTTGRELWSVGPAIQGPSGEPGDSSSSTKVAENNKFIFKFGADSNDKPRWEINGGADASLFKIGKNNGKLEFKSSPNFEKPQDKNKDNSFEVYVRATQRKSGFNADQQVIIKLTDINEDRPDGGLINNNDGALPNQNQLPPPSDASDEILYYTADCGPMTANGPLNPCDEESSDGTSSGGGGSSATSKGPVSPPDDVRLTTNGRRNYNSYNDYVDDFNQTNDCDYIGYAKTNALSQLNSENDSTLAVNWNALYADECNLSKIIV